MDKKIGKIGEQRRQGDVFFQRVESIPEDAKVDKSGVFAEGEVSGHLHQIEPGSDATMLVSGDLMFADVKAPTNVIHPEHNTVHLDEGQWSVIIQEQNTPAGWKRVED